VLPSFRKSSTDKAEPIRAILRRAIELPRCDNSRTDSENRDPKRANPNSDIEEPSRLQVRSAKDDPKWRKSRTDKADPIRAKDLNDMDAPIVMKSNTATADARRAKLRSDKEAPR